MQRHGCQRDLQNMMQAAGPDLLLSGQDAKSLVFVIKTAIQNWRVQGFAALPMSEKHTAYRKTRDCRNKMALFGLAREAHCIPKPRPRLP